MPRSFVAAPFANSEKSIYLFRGSFKVAGPLQTFLEQQFSRLVIGQILISCSAMTSPSKVRGAPHGNTCKLKGPAFMILAGSRGCVCSPKLQRPGEPHDIAV